MRSQGRGHNGSGVRSRNANNGKSDLEVKTDELERRLKEKIDVMSGFGDAEMQARKLQQCFAYFDMNGGGTIDYQEFFAAMTKLNFVGVQKEIETLFNRYDEDASGDLNYKEFAYSLFGLGNKPTMDVNSRNIVEKVKARILEKDGASGIHKVARILSRMDHDGSKTLDQDELMEGLRVYGISRIPPSELQQLFNYFDRDRSGKISVEEFLRGLKSGMSFERKQIVREAFNLLDKSGDGVVTVEDILQNYDFSFHPSVSNGSISSDEAATEMLSCFESTGDVDGRVTWAEFLDYYKGISLSIDDDDYFELMMRNAWHLSGGTGWNENTSCKRVLVTHSDGSDEIVEVKNDLGLNYRDMNEVRRRLERQGVQDIRKIQL